MRTLLLCALLLTAAGPALAQSEQGLPPPREPPWERIIKERILEASVRRTEAARLEREVLRDMLGDLRFSSLYSRRIPTAEEAAARDRLRREISAIDLRIQTEQRANANIRPIYY